MKKSLLALAVLATAGAASAQSSVTLFGIVDAGVARVYGAGTKKTGMTNSGLNSSRLGFRGTEDLGGGMAASFWLEGQLDNDTGSGRSSAPTGGLGGFNFQRRSTVSLSGNFGEVRLGRDYAPNFWNITVFDPFGTNGVGQSQAVGMLGAPVRNSNAVGYFLPGNLGGFYGQLQYAFGEQPNGVKTGNYLGFRAGYAAGPLNVAFSHAKLNAATSAADVKTDNIGASYDFGIVKPMFVWTQEKNSATKVKAWEIGATAPLGAGELRAAYSKYDPDGAGNANLFAIGYGHNLSKRTQLYTTFARLKNKGGMSMAVGNNGLSGMATANGKSGGFEFGVRHSF